MNPESAFWCYEWRAGGVVYHRFDTPDKAQAHFETIDKRRKISGYVLEAMTADEMARHVESRFKNRINAKTNQSLISVETTQSREIGPRLPPAPPKPTGPVLRLEPFTTATKDTGVLIHFAHGLGDMVMLGYITPFLEPSNRYFIVGGYSGCPSIFEGHPFVRPLYPTINNATIRGRSVHFLTDEDTAAILQDAGTTHILYGFPEICGSAPPFHSKPRARLQNLIDNASRRLADTVLRNDIQPTVTSEIQQIVKSRLRAVGLTTGRQLCLIGRAGVTNSRKDWPWQHGADFIELINKHRPHWLMMSFDHPNRTKRGLSGAHGALSTETIVAGIPFGVAIRALFKFTDLFIGVPSGPWCVSCLFDNFPTIGLWHSLWPSWYMEPKPQGVNLIAAGVRAQGHDKAPGSVTEIGAASYPIKHVEKLDGHTVFENVEKWL